MQIAAACILIITIIAITLSTTAESKSVYHGGYGAYKQPASQAADHSQGNDRPGHKKPTSSGDDDDEDDDKEPADSDADGDGDDDEDNDNDKDEDKPKHKKPAKSHRQRHHRKQHGKGPRLASGFRLRSPRPSASAIRWVIR